MVHKEEVRQQFAKRLHEALDALGIQRHGRGVWLSKQAKVSAKACNKWLNGETMPEGWRIPEISTTLNVSPMWLQYGKSASAPIEEEAAWLGAMEAWDSDSGSDPDTVELPLFREVEMSAGAGQTQVIENHGAKLKFARSSLRRAGVQEENAACAYITGNSMEPSLPDGATVGVDTGTTHIKDGSVYAIDHEGMLRVKQVYRLPGGGIRLTSFNKQEHPDEEYAAEEFQRSIRIIGRIFWSATFW